MESPHPLIPSPNALEKGNWNLAPLAQYWERGQEIVGKTDMLLIASVSTYSLNQSTLHKW